MEWPLYRGFNSFFNIKSSKLWTTDKGVRGMRLTSNLISRSIEDGSFDPPQGTPHQVASHHKMVIGLCTRTLPFFTIIILKPFACHFIHLTWCKLSLFSSLFPNLFFSKNKKYVTKKIKINQIDGSDWLIDRFMF